MHILFCDNPGETKQTVDLDYQDEFTAAQRNGFSVHLYSFESLVSSKNPQEATKNIPHSEGLETILYRGWMLRPEQYLMLYEALLAKNYRLINSPLEYKNCHYLPDSYRFIAQKTPKTIWLKMENREVDYDKVFREIEIFGNSPLIIKDYVKSQKHYWETACFIPSAQDKEKVKSVIAKFLALQGENLNEGLVIREFFELAHLTIHSKSKMPLTQEYRLFFLKKKLLGCYNYWEEGEYLEDEKPPLETFEKIAQKVESNFFSMDIAKTKSGDWIIIELGDGQVAGLPDKVNRNEFYKMVCEV